MSLQLWLPMTKDFNNQGLQNSTITNNSATLDNNGKLGKCGYFSGSTYLKGTIDCASWVDYTLACWIKPPAASAGNKQVIAIGKSSGWTNCRATIVYVQNSTDVIAGLSDGTNSIQYGMRITLTANAWNHVAVTYSNKTLKFYLNGVYQKSYTTTFDPKFSDITNFGVAGASDGAEKFTGYLNDVRIYDHALSPREIEILSRGLVCHYPLNNNGGGQPNLYDFESVASKWAIDGLTLANATDDVYGNVLKITSPSSVSSQRIYRTVSNVWKADTKFTVSFLAKASKTAVVKMSRSLANYAPDVTVGTTWKRYSTVITCSTTVDGGTLSIQTSTASADIYLTQIKLELGDKATAYQPGVGDSHYTPLGYGDTSIYDVSGYQYNGINANDLATIQSETPRYSCSMKLNSVGDITKNGSATNASYIQANVRLTTPNEITISFWGKLTTSYGGNWHGIMCTSASTYPNDYQTSAFNYRDAGFDVNSADGASHLRLGLTIQSTTGWHHYVVTYDGQYAHSYTDGVLKDTKAFSAKTALGSFNKVVLGMSYAGGVWRMTNSNYSDLRVYATCLSDTQVAELYNTAVSVANNGSLLGYELVEG